MANFFAVTIALLSTYSCCYQPPSIVAGNYYFYSREQYGKSGWYREEERTLSLRPDSSYLLVYLKPQEGFERLPDSGKWSIKDEKLILYSIADTEWKSPDYRTLTFYFRKDGSLWQKQEKVPWKKKH